VIAIQKIGKSFAGALNYNLKKFNHPNEQKRAELLDTNFSSLDAKLIVREVELIRSFKPNLNRYVYHTTLNFSNEDFLNSEQMMEIAKEYLAESGYTNNQYAIFRHYDAEHPHVHLLVNRITFDGEVVSDSNNYKKSEAILRKLEAKHNLVSVAPSKEAAVRAVTKGEIEMMERTGKPSDKLLLQELMNNLLSQKGMDLSELIEKGEQAGIHFLFNQASTGRVSGITYFYSGLKIRGQALGNRYKWAELIKTITYEQGKHGQGISQANSRTTAKYGDITGAGATAEAGSRHAAETGTQPAGRNRQTAAQAGMAETELAGRTGTNGQPGGAGRPGAGKAAVAANLIADAAQRQSERRILAGIAGDISIGRSADRAIGGSTGSARAAVESASQTNPLDHADPGSADWDFDHSTDTAFDRSTDTEFYGSTDIQIADDIDDEAIHGRNRHRQKKARTNRR